MKLKSAYNELVFGGHLLSLGTASIAGAAALVLGKSPSLTLLVMAYLFSNGAYTLNRASEADQDSISSPERTAYLSGRRRFLPAIAGSYFLAGYLLAFFSGTVFFLALLVPLALAILYSVSSSKMVRVVGARRLKDRLLLKNVAISFGWSLIPLLVGLYYQMIPLSLLLLSPFIFLRLMTNTIFFDERDVEADQAYGTRTIPSTYGAAVSNRIMSVIDVCSLTYIVAVVALALVPAFSMALAVFPFYSFAYRFAAKSANGDALRDLVADGEYVLWMPVIFLGKI